MTRTRLLVVYALLTAACGARVASNGGTDSSTHWLDTCDEDADCKGELECICSVCTQPCNSESSCESLAGSRPTLCAELTCADDRAGSSCTLACDGDTECPSDLTCVNGACEAGNTSPSPAPVAPSSEEVELDVFEAAFLQVNCEHIINCRTGSTERQRLLVGTVERCVAMAADIAPMRDVRARVEAARTGVLTYDPVAAARCIDSVSDGCGLFGEPELDFDWTRWLCPEVFDGKVAVGESCNDDVECSGDARCVESSGHCGGTCQSRSQLGEDCGAGSDCTRTEDGLPLACEETNVATTCEARTVRRGVGEGQACERSPADSLYTKEMATCAEGLFCTKVAEVLACLPAYSLGEACPNGSGDQVVCADGSLCTEVEEGAAARVCQRFELQTEAGTACSGPAGCDLLAGLDCDDQTRTCVFIGDGSLGAPCGGVTCASGLYCGEAADGVYRCAERLRDGAECESSVACESDRCVSSGDTRVCAPRYCSG